LRAVLPSEELPTLAEVPDVGESVELPDLPDLDDPKSVQAWRDAVAQMSYERGLERGLERGRREGLEEGVERGRREGLERAREERARAVVEVLRRRGVALTDEQAQRITECRDEVTLTRWWERVWLVSTVEEL
jgi:flagellar biosynthesis/type III secretory pathway protein FliH